MASRCQSTFEWLSSTIFLVAFGVYKRTLKKLAGQIR
jgi:hypothetical protein